MLWWCSDDKFYHTLLLFNVKELKDRYPQTLSETWPPGKFPDPGLKLLCGLHLFPATPFSLIGLSFYILNVHSLHQLFRLSKNGQMQWFEKGMHSKLLLLKISLRDLQPSSLLSVPASLWAANQNSPPRGIHWKFITHHQLLSTRLSGIQKINSQEFWVTCLYLKFTWVKPNVWDLEPNQSLLNANDIIKEKLNLCFTQMHYYWVLFSNFSINHMVHLQREEIGIFSN